MKNPIRNIAFILMATTLAFSCTKRVDIPLRPGDEKLVVEGYLFGSDSVSWVKLSKTSGYFSNEPPPPVSRATLVVGHKTQQWELEESATHPGLYFLKDSSFHLVTSDTFNLKIQLRHPIGNHSVYNSRTVVPPLHVQIDSLQIEYAPDFKKWMVRYFGQDLPGKDYYLFNSLVNTKTVTDSILQKVVRQDIYFDGRYVSGAVVQVLDEGAMKVGDHYTLLASNITAAYYNYMVALQDEIGKKNPLFSGPPANVPSNIDNGALGFFTSFLTTAYRVKLEKNRGDWIDKPVTR